MKRTKYFAWFVLAVSLLVLPGAMTPRQPLPSPHARQEKREVKVWVNTSSGVYHCPGSRWYGSTKHGKYMSECEAIKAGYRAAYGKPCGQDCR